MADRARLSIIELFGLVDDRLELALKFGALLSLHDLQFIEDLTVVFICSQRRLFLHHVRVLECRILFVVNFLLFADDQLVDHFVFSIEHGISLLVTIVTLQPDIALLH